MAAVTLGIGGVAGVIGVATGTAGATTSNKITATTSPTITSNNTTQAVGNIHVTLAGSTAYATKDLKVTASPPSGTLTWKTKPVVVVTESGTPTTVAAATVSTSGHLLTVELPTIASTVATVTVKITTNQYKVTGSKTGNVKLNATLTSGATTTTHTILSTSFTGHTTAHNATIALAAGSARGNSITAASAPSVPKTGTGNAAGSLTIDLRGNGTIAANTYVDLTTSATSGNVYWNAASLSATGVTATFTTAHKPAGTIATNTEVAVKLTSAIATGATAVVHVTGITYNTSGAEGTVTVTPRWLNNAVVATATTTYGTFSPATAVNAKAPAAPTSRAHVHTLVAKTTPFIGRGVSGAAGNWTLHLSATPTTATAAKGEGWTATTTITVNVKNNAAHNCSSSTNFVLVTGTPSATVATAKTVSATPTVKVTTAATGTTCRVNDHNVVSLTFTNSGTFTGVTGSFHILVSGVKYSVGSGATLGNVSVKATFTAATGAVVFQAASTTNATHTPAGASNADVTLLYVSANTPAVTLAQNAYDAPISPIDVVETAAAQVPASYVCVSLAATNAFNTAATATAKVTKGTGTVTSKVTYETAAGAKATTTASAHFARFKVTKESAVTASTYALSGLKVNASGTQGSVTATVKHVATATNCAATGTSIGSATAYSIKAAPSTQIYGSTADATAAKELENRFTASTITAHHTHCVGDTIKSTGNAVRPVILATDKTYQDALASQYLASVLNTGTLLTPQSGLSSVTLSALKTEGVTQVDVVGGPLAVSTTVVNTLMTTPAYTCGGASVLKTGTKTVYIHVTRIWGETQYDTAQRIAEFVATSNVASAAFPQAYAGVNTTAGNGKFNDTAGSASAAPLTSSTLKTAILASGVEFQDAEAASALSYATKFPILLTTPTALSSQASAAIATLGVKQVIVMGGPLAVSNSVVTSLESLGLSVLRVAGKSYTDTAVQLAKFEESAPTVGRDWDTGHMAVARGNGFTDGLAGAVIAGFNKYPQLLTENPTTVGTYLTAFLKAYGQTGTKIDAADGSKISSLTIFGGPLAVTPTVVNKMQTDIS